MLFDLRSRGRRSTVKVVYIGLAAIFLLGFVGLGVGGGFGSSGILSSLTNSESSSSASFANQIKKYRKQTEQKPSDLAAWEGLTKNLLHEGGSETYVTSAGTVTSKGKALFRETSQAWKSYLALNPPKPSLELAKEMVTVYGASGLDEPTHAVEALQIITATETKSASWYSQLAVYAYQAKNTGLGDLASAKAVALAPAAQRTRLKNELAEAKKNPTGEKTYTTVTNGKTYAVKKAANGKYEGVEIPKTTSKGATTSTSTSAKKTTGTGAGSKTTSTTKK